MAKIEGVNRVIAALKKLAEKAENPSVVVGYTQNYALYVHENLAAHHNVGQAKYLEQPARQLPLASVVRDTVMAGGTLLEGLLKAGLYLQRESQLLVPVKYGLLKASAFTEAE